MTYKWGKLGAWWAYRDDEGIVVYYRADEDEGRWVVHWDWSLDSPALKNSEFIPLNEKSELELRTYLKHKYLLLRGG